DGPSQRRERREAAALSPADPSFEARNGLSDRGGMENGTEGLFEQVGSVQSVVELGNPAERFPLRGCEVFGVLPHGPTRVLEERCGLRQGGIAQVVPDLPTDLVEGLGGPLHDVEGIETSN